MASRSVCFKLYTQSTDVLQDIVEDTRDGQFFFIVFFLLACLFLCVFLKLWRVIHCVTVAINGVKQRIIVRVH